MLFIVWQKTIGGRLKSDPSFSSSLVWNNFPMPPVTQYQRQRICVAGEGILSARAEFPEKGEERPCPVEA